MRLFCIDENVNAVCWFHSIFSSFTSLNLHKTINFNCIYLETNFLRLVQLCIKASICTQSLYDVYLLLCKYIIYIMYYYILYIYIMYRNLLQNYTKNYHVLVYLLIFKVPH